LTLCFVGERWDVVIDTFNQEQQFTGTANIAYPSDDPDKRLMYKGSIKDNALQQGRLKYRDGDEQVGTWDEDGRPCGKGLYISRSGDYLQAGRWEGGYKEGEEDGAWRFTDLTSQFFEVVFKDGKEQSRVAHLSMTQPAQPRVLPFVPILDVNVFIRQDNYSYAEAPEWTADGEQQRAKALLGKTRFVDFQNKNISQARRKKGVAVILTEDDVFDVSSVHDLLHDGFGNTMVSGEDSLHGDTYAKFVILHLR
jgi:hypothetical protein